MGATLSLFKTLFIPAAISLALYLLLTQIIFPLWQRHRAKYSRYLPLEAINTQTNTIRDSIQAAALRLLLPSTWTRRHDQERQFVDDDDTDDGNDGEELGIVDTVDERRRAALSLDARRSQGDDNRRLSRDLEQVFRDDSEDDDEPVVQHHNR